MQEFHIPLNQTPLLSVVGFAPPGATWTSSNPAVATVEPKGVGRHCTIRPVATGECTLTVETDGRKGTLLVRVVDEAIGLERLKLVGRDIPRGDGTYPDPRTGV